MKIGLLECAGTLLGYLVCANCENFIYYVGFQTTEGSNGSVEGRLFLLHIFSETKHSMRSIRKLLYFLSCLCFSFLRGQTKEWFRQFNVVNAQLRSFEAGLADSFYDSSPNLVGRYS